MLASKLRPTVPRLEAALGGEPTTLLCPQGHGIVFSPGWWCDDCEACAYPLLLLDADHEPNGDDEPGGDDEPDDDYG